MMNEKSGTAGRRNGSRLYIPRARHVKPLPCHAYSGHTSKSPGYDLKWWITGPMASNRPLMAINSAQNEFLSVGSNVAPSAIMKHRLAELLSTATHTHAADASFLPGLKPPSEKNTSPAALAINAAAFLATLVQLVFVCMTCLAK